MGVRFGVPPPSRKETNGESTHSRQERSHRPGARRQGAAVWREGTVEPYADDREATAWVGVELLERATAAVSTYYGGYHGGQQQLKKKQLSRAITGAVTHGGLIQITSAGHGFNTEDRITITGVGGTVEANAAKWRITVTGVNTFDLQGSTFTNAYTSGGTAVRTQG